MVNGHDVSWKATVGCAEVVDSQRFISGPNLGTIRLHRSTDIVVCYHWYRMINLTFCVSVSYPCYKTQKWKPYQRSTDQRDQQNILVQKSISRNGNCGAIGNLAVTHQGERYTRCASNISSLVGRDGVQPRISLLYNAISEVMLYSMLAYTRSRILETARARRDLHRPT